MTPHSIHTIYFGLSAVYITTEPMGIASELIVADVDGTVSWAKIIKKVETNKSVTILTSDPDRAFERLKGEVRVVRAAGGVVTNERGEVLMIELRRRWDLPKGHIDEGEDSLTAALREVEEETGIVASATDDYPLTTTWHAYNIYGPWELKSTDWWAMHYVGGEPKPQHDEGISRVRWVDSTELEECLKLSYPTIKEVVARYIEK